MDITWTVITNNWIKPDKPSQVEMICDVIGINWTERNLTASLGSLIVDGWKRRSQVRMVAICCRREYSVLQTRPLAATTATLMLNKVGWELGDSAR